MVVFIISCTGLSKLQRKYLVNSDRFLHFFLRFIPLQRKSLLIFQPRRNVQSHKRLIINFLPFLLLYSRKVQIISPKGLLKKDLFLDIILNSLFLHARDYFYFFFENILRQFIPTSHIIFCLNDAKYTR